MPPKRSKPPVARATPKAGSDGAAAWLLWDSVPDVMYRVRGAEGTIEFLSAAFATLTGWPAAEWIGRPFAELVYAEDLPQAIDKYAAVLRGEKHAPFELRVRTRDGGFDRGRVSQRPPPRAGAGGGRAGHRP